MKRLIWLGLLGLGGCVASPPSYYAPTAMLPVDPDSQPVAPSPFIAPVPGGSTAPLPPPVEAAPLSPDAADGQPAPPDAGTGPAADIPPDAQPGDTGNLDDTIARLRGGQDAPPPDADTTAADPATPPAPAAPPPAIASAPPAAPPPITDMTRHGFHDHYGGLNSDGDVPAH